jgi:predicted secreted protein
MEEHHNPNYCYSEDTLPSTLVLQEKRKITVILEEMTSAGYSWNVSCIPEDTAEDISVEHFPSNQEGIVGAPGTAKISFVGANTGTVLLVYKRPWEHKIEKELSVKIIMR